MEGQCYTVKKKSVALEPSSIPPVQCHQEISIGHEVDSAWDSNESSPRADPPLRLMQWNVHGWRDTHHNDNIAEIISHVREAAPDVLVLNEVLHPYALPVTGAVDYLQLVRSGQGNGYVDPNPPTDQQSYLQRLADATGLKYFVFGRAVEDGYFGQYGFGNAILSRYELSEVTHTVLRADSFKYAETRRIEAEDRCVSSATVMCGPTPVSVVTTHLDQLDEGLRVQQSRVISAQMRQQPGSILVGDLNTYQQSDYSDQAWQDLCQMWAAKNWGSPPEKSSTLEALAGEGLQDAHYLCKSNAGQFAEPTCWVIEPLFRIDYFLFDREAASKWNVEQIDRVIEASCSDHFPIVMDLVPSNVTN